MAMKSEINIGHNDDSLALSCSNFNKQEILLKSETKWEGNEDSTVPYIQFNNTLQFLSLDGKESLYIINID